MHDSLSGKRVVVTAGASGIGRAIALAFAEAGARVRICDVATDALADFITAASGVAATHVDVAKPDDVDRLFDEVETEMGGLDVLVNNAGIAGPTGPIEDMSHIDWCRTIDVNLNGMFLCLRRAVPLLKQAGGGAIVNLASTAGIMGYPLRAPYAASKWAVVGLTKSLAMELGDARIRVNAICPGAVIGDRMERVIAAEAAAKGHDPEAVRASYVKNVSMHCFIDPAEIADTALFLCSDAGAKISGQVISVDGHTETLAS